jgi:hypothetical protein
MSSLLVAGVLVAGASFGLRSANAIAPTPDSFLRDLSSAIRSGNSQFLFSTLNSAVIKRFGAATCRDFVKTVHDPTARYTLISAGKPSPFTYATPGVSTVVPNVIPVKVRAMRDGTNFHATLHIGESGHPVHYSWFTNCSQVTQFAGTYTGTWTDTTFNSGGPITVVIAIQGAGGIGSPVQLQLTLGGDVFGGSAPPTQTFSGSVSATGLGFTGSSPIFGNVVWQLSTSGVFSATGASVPGGNVSNFSASGSISGAQLSATFRISLLDGMTATGTMSAVRG